MRLFTSLTLTFVLVACSDASTSVTPSGSGVDAGASGNASSSGGSSSGSVPRPTGPYKSYVTLGDSISDRGGVAPYFYDLLAKNDDAAYPDYAGKDFATLYPGLKVYKQAVSGSVSADLIGQIASIPDNLEAPVVVTITIGGNDVQAATVRILRNQDAADKAAFEKNLGEAYAALKQKVPGAVVFHANIYDPGDGKGDYSRCPSPLNLIPAFDSSVPFAAWNTIVSDSTAKEGSTLIGFHDAFMGHGLVPTEQNWFAADCIHPSKIGHNEIRKLFLKAITGM